MNKTQLIEQVARNADLPKAKAGNIVDIVLGVIEETLSEGDFVAIAGFGVFSVKERAARIGRNPQTGEKIEISASMVPGFKAGKSLKEAVNQCKTAREVEES